MYSKSFLVGSTVPTLYCPHDDSILWYSRPVPHCSNVLDDSIFCHTAAGTFPYETFTLAHAKPLANTDSTETW